MNVWVNVCMYVCMYVHMYFVILPMEPRASVGELPASEPHSGPTLVSIFLVFRFFLKLSEYPSTFLSKLAYSIVVFYFGFACNRPILDRACFWQCRLLCGEKVGGIQLYSPPVSMESSPNFCLLIGSIVFF